MSGGGRHEFGEGVACLPVVDDAAIWEIAKDEA